MYQFFLGGTSPNNFGSNVQSIFISLNILGRILLLYSNSENSMETRELTLPGEWCLTKNDQILKTGDFNADSFTDLLCHNSEGKMKILIHMKGNLLLPPEKEVCEGYVFTGVCLSQGGSLSGGVSVPGVLCLGDLCLRGDLCPLGLCHGDHLLR